MSALDTSFELPVDIRDYNNPDPIPLGDEVSSGRISREIPVVMDHANYNPNPSSNGGYNNQYLPQSSVTPDSNRVQGRRQQQPRTPVANGSRTPVGNGSVGPKQTGMRLFSRPEDKF
jgi:hypothetical protein